MTTRSDAILAVVIDFLKERLSDTAKRAAECGVTTNTTATTGPESGFFEAIKLPEEGSVPQEALRRLQTLLPIAYVKVSQKCSQSFQTTL